jgi:hypothetical protein
MNNENMVKFSVDKDMVRDVLERKVEEAVGVALIDKERVVSELIRKCLDLRVDSNGRPCTYSSAVPYLQYAADVAIHAAVENAMRATLEKRSKQLEAAVAKQIARSTNKLAKSLVSGLEESLKCRWSSTIKIVLDGDKEGEICPS